MKARKILAAIVRHGSLILALFLMTASILNDYNPGMMFLTNNTSVAILRIFCVLGIIGYFIRAPKNEKA